MAGPIEIVVAVTGEVNMLGYDDKRNFFRMMVNSPCQVQIIDDEPQPGDERDVPFEVVEQAAAEDDGLQVEGVPAAAAARQARPTGAQRAAGRERSLGRSCCTP